MSGCWRCRESVTCLDQSHAQKSWAEMSVQDVVQKYSASWSAEAWAQAYARALAYVFELPHARSMDSADSQDMVRDLSSETAFIAPCHCL